jgi:hypothetical protein
MRENVLYLIKERIITPLLGVEVGVRFGDHASKMLSFLGIDRLFLVDHFLPYQDGLLIQTVEDQDRYYKAMFNNLAFNNKVIFITKTSEFASTLFANNSLDFVYIDANHSYQSVKEDMELWFSKVKYGGILCGHDYNNGEHDGVKRAVDEFVLGKNLELEDCNKDWGVIKR